MRFANTDYLVAGGGIIRISAGRELRRRQTDAAVTVLEKGPAVGRHASGRNSGVLHAGFYYTAESLKARFTRDGNAALREYCREKGLPLNKCRKLVVARTAADHPQMDEMRGRQRRDVGEHFRRRGTDDRAPREDLRAGDLVAQHGRGRSGRSDRLDAERRRARGCQSARITGQ